eukprot:2389642-Rhodomonas_salina.3
MGPGTNKRKKKKKTIGRDLLNLVTNWYLGRVEGGGSRLHYQIQLPLAPHASASPPSMAAVPP